MTGCPRGLVIGFAGVGGLVSAEGRRGYHNGSIHEATGAGREEVPYNISGVQAKVPASKKRKKRKEAVAKLRPFIWEFSKIFFGKHVSFMLF